MRTLPVRLDDQTGIVEVITLCETDLGIYRLPGGMRLTNLLARQFHPPRMNEVR